MPFQLTVYVIGIVPVSDVHQSICIYQIWQLPNTYPLVLPFELVTNPRKMPWCEVEYFRRLCCSYLIAFLCDEHRFGKVVS